MSIKQSIAKIIPNSILQRYYVMRKYHLAKPLYKYNAKRFAKYGASQDSEEAMIGMLTMAAHGLEKGFTMPDFRPGFGHDRICNLLDDSESYIAKYGTENIQIVHIAKIINEYKCCHEKIGYQLEEQLRKKIITFLSKFDLPEKTNIQIDSTKSDFFSHCNDDFKSFSNSRHSCRDFSTESVPVETINAAVSLAQNAPSACNRQAARVYVIEDKEKIAQVFSLHGGNRGFGHTVDKLIVVCGFISCYGMHERDCVYTDCGIFTMNLAYALHYYGVGNCILNWSVTNDKDLKCREILPIKKEEVICTLIACGNVPEKFKVCTSGKKALKDIIRYI